MRNHNFIDGLVNDLSKPSESKNWFSLFFFSWMGCASILAMFTYLAMSFMPQDIHLPRNTGFSFWFHSALWFGLSVTAALTAYSHSLIGKNLPVYRLFSRVFAIAVVVSALMDLSWFRLSDDLNAEFDFYQGPCGGFIFLTGFLAANWMWVVIKRATPLNSRRTGMWAAVSVGAIGSGFMHMVCTHEGHAHELMWHVVPLILLTGLGAILGKKWIRW